MVRLQEILNDFHNYTHPEVEDAGDYKFYHIQIEDKNFEVQYQKQQIPLRYCLMYTDPETKQSIQSQGLSPDRMALNFQFFYVDAQGNKSQQDQNFENGVIFRLIRQLAGFLKHMTDNEGVDTLIFGGDSERREPLYDTLSNRIVKEGWFLAKGHGAGPTGEPGTFYALFKRGS